MIDADRGPERLPPLSPEEMSEAQKAAVSAIVSGPRGKLQGPFVPMLRSPGFMERAQRLGEYIRYHSVLPDNLRELAILVTARHWNQAVEWAIHAPIALASGVGPDTIDDIAAGQPPRAGSAEERAVYEFCVQLHERQDVDDEAYRGVLTCLGEAGVIDLTGLCGYYAMLAMVMNVARTPVGDQ